MNCSLHLAQPLMLSCIWSFLFQVKTRNHDKNKIEYLQQHYALINQLWGPYSIIFGPLFWGTDRMKWASLRPILPCPDAINWMLDSVLSSKCLLLFPNVNIDLYGNMFQTHDNFMYCICVFILRDSFFMYCICVFTLQKYSCIALFNTIYIWSASFLWQ